MNSINLLYKGAISDLVVLNQEKLSYFTEDKAQLVAYDATLNDPFADNWQTEINQAAKLAQDEVIIESQVSLKQKELEKLQQCRAAYQQYIYFAGLAFANNAIMIDELGKKDYHNCRQSESKMVTFMETLYINAVKYQSEFNNAGYTMDMINNLELKSNELKDIVSRYKAYKNTRGVLTQDRIVQLNHLYNTMNRVCTVGKQVFVNDPARYHRYVIYDNQHPTASKIALVTNQTPLKPINMQVIGDAGNNIIVDFGDGMGNKIIFNNQLQTETHNYSKPWNYDINITGNVDTLVKFGMPSSGINTITLPASGNEELIEISLQDNELTAASINALLQTIDSYGTYNGTIHLTGGSNAAPTGDGITALQKLKERMWTVETN